LASNEEARELAAFLTSSGIYASVEIWDRAQIICTVNNDPSMQTRWLMVRHIVQFAHGILVVVQNAVIAGDHEAELRNPPRLQFERKRLSSPRI
jgi:hypothetical protein